MGTVVPLHIISGFLGVGKTTAILGLLKKLDKGERLAILVNERGKVGLDGVVLQSETPGLVLREVTGGCICCTAGPSLISSLQEILEKVAPERILLEPSGLGKPGDIADLIDSTNMNNRVGVRPIVTLVDPAYFVEPRIMELPVYRDQVEAADILVANRCDLAAEETLKTFYRKAKELFPPKAMILTTSFGDLPEEIFSLEQKHVAGRMHWVSPSTENPPGHAHRGAAPSDTTGFREEGWIWPPETRFEHHKLRKTLETISNRLGTHQSTTLRLKGIFQTDRGWHVMEVALEGVFERTTQYRRDSRCQVILDGGNAEMHLKEIGRLLNSCILKQRALWRE